MSTKDGKKEAETTDTTTTKAKTKETTLDDEEDEHELPIDKELTAREIHTLNWMKKEGRKVLQQYFDCEPFHIEEDEGDLDFWTNANSEDAYLPPPTEKEPEPLDSYKFIHEIYEQAIPKLIVSEKIRGNYFTLMAGLNISQAISFSVVMMRFGGYYFLIPFILSTILITFPINFVQYSIGQFTNMPPIVLFSRLSPIFVGIGFLIIVVQYITAAALRFDHRFVAMAFELFYSLTADTPSFDGRSRVQGILYGYRPICPPGEIYHENACYPKDQSNYQFGKTDREYIQFKVRSELQSDQFIADYATAETPPDRIFDPIYQHSHFISAATVLSIFLFFASLLWVKAYFRRIQHIVFFGSLITCIITLVSVASNWGRQATILISVIGADSTKLLELKTWVIAAIHSLIIFCTVDGSYLAIGSINQFSNRIFIDLIRAKILGFLFLILFSTVFGMITVVGASLWMMRIEKRPLTAEDYRVLIYSDKQVFEFLYVYFFQTMAHKLLMLIFMLLISFWEISSLMLMAEGSVGTVYRMFKSTARLPQFIIRYVSMVFHCSFVLFTHFFMHQHHQIPFLLAPYVVFVQILAIPVMNYRRFITIVLTLNKRHRMGIYKFRKWIQHYYRFLLFLIILIIIYEIYSNGIKMAKHTLEPVLILALCQLVRYRFVSKYSKSWMPTQRFKPSYYQDLDEYKRQERAMNGHTELIVDDAEKELEKEKKLIGRETEEQKKKRLEKKEEKEKKLRRAREPFKEPPSVAERQLVRDRKKKEEYDQEFHTYPLNYYPYNYDFDTNKTIEYKYYY